MLRLTSFLYLSTCLCAGFAKAQDASALSSYFEGKQVVVKMDMPATQEGVDVYPKRPQPLDLNNYSKRLKKYGVALRNGDSVMITRFRIKDKNIEFQLAGGGYGTMMDDTDTSTHFTPSDKSAREKDLEDQIKRETDPDRRRSLQRQLDDARDSRERRDRRDRQIAQDAADAKKARIDNKRLNGGSRFNIRYDVKIQAIEVTPQSVMAALTQYVTFPAEAFGGASGNGDPAPAAVPTALESRPAAPAEAAPSAPSASLKKGMTLAQVEELFGQPVNQQVRDQDGLKVTLCTFQSEDATIKADFVNGVLVQYTLSSR